MTELLGGSARYKVLRCVYEHPDRIFATRELAGLAGIDPGNASRWFRRWADVGLLERHIERGRTLFRASRDPSLAPLRQLLQHHNETAIVLRERVKDLGLAVERAAIFGSTARGEAGPDSDIDVLLIASGLSRLKAQAHFKSTGRRLGRPVNVQVYTPDAWATAAGDKDPFVSNIASSPLVMLKGDLNA